MTKTSNVILANNTNVDLRMFDAHLMAVVRGEVTLSEDLSDLITVTIIEVADGARGIINWA